MSKFVKIMDREEVFALKFQGIDISEEQMFKTLPAFSPTGMPKRLPATPVNLYKYQKYLNSLKKYIEEGEELGYVLDSSRRQKY